MHVYTFIGCTLFALRITRKLEFPSDIFTTSVTQIAWLGLFCHVHVFHRLLFIDHLITHSFLSHFER